MWSLFYQKTAILLFLNKHSMKNGSTPHGKGESGWHEDWWGGQMLLWLTNCFHIETISMGKFHKPLSGSPSKPIFDAHFAASS